MACASRRCVRLHASRPLMANPSQPFSFLPGARARAATDGAMDAAYVGHRGSAAGVLGLIILTNFCPALLIVNLYLRLLLPWSAAGLLLQSLLPVSEAVRLASCRRGIVPGTVSEFAQPASCSSCLRSSGQAVAFVRESCWHRGCLSRWLACTVCSIIHSEIGAAQLQGTVLVRACRRSRRPPCTVPRPVAQDQSVHPFPAHAACMGQHWHCCWRALRQLPTAATNKRQRACTNAWPSMHGRCCCWGSRCRCWPSSAWSAAPAGQRLSELPHG